jgi:hypothetical protein
MIEFDSEELKAIRRTRAVATNRGSRPINSDTLVPFLRIAEGLNVSALRAIRQRVYGMRGTPQHPTDSSDPDRWIQERLQGDEPSSRASCGRGLPARSIHGTYRAGWLRSNDCDWPRYPTVATH